MLFVSDLDQTLIYSRKFIIDPVMGQKMNVRLVETRENEEISFMTEDSIKKLKALILKLAFVPVTTRTIEQYQRISIFQNEIVPDYAIVSNGGNVIIKGKIDEDWHRGIRDKINMESLPYPDMLEAFNKISNENWIISNRKADDLFVYFITHQNNIPHEELNHYKEWIEKKGWTMSLQGRKLYFVPNCINKWSAIEYIKEQAGAHMTFAAGDSVLDLCMLSQADYAFAPRHGELARMLEAQNNAGSIKITTNSGFLAAEEILDSINKTLTLMSF